MDADNAGIEAQVGGGRRASGLYLAHLVDCALHGAAPEVLPEGASWEEVHALAARNGMEGASWRRYSSSCGIAYPVISKKCDGVHDVKAFVYH